MSGYLRGKTYQIVASGLCPCCGEFRELRFVYGGADQDDYLACVRCGEQSDQDMKEAADTP